MFLREDIVFGPIISRRLGVSLGVNVLPVNGKICNFDCIYCECGWNRDGRDDSKLPTAAQVRSALEEKLAEFLLEGKTLDVITFSGDGEPTVNPDFPRIIDDTLALRDIYCPDTKVAVLSNATRAHIPEVFRALTKVDSPIMKIDAPTNELIEKINHPAPGYDVARIIKSLEKFNGDFILQTMFLKSADFDSASPEVNEGWKDIVRHLHPREIMAYTIDRPTPEKDLVRFTPGQIRELVQPLIDEGFNIQIRG